MSTQKKNSKRTGTTSSRTRSGARPTAGRGETSPSQKQESQEDNTDVPLADVKMSLTKKRKQTTSSPLSPLLTDSQVGTLTQHGYISEEEASKFYASRATASKPEPKTSNERLLDPADEPNYALKQAAALSAQSRANDREEWRKKAHTELSAVGRKNDSEKPSLAYIPKTALWAEGEAFAFGARKYDQFNYKNGIAITRTLSAALRHIVQFLDGEDLDSESGVSHLGCARANLGMALDTLANHPEMDDRFKGGKK